MIDKTGRSKTTRLGPGKERDFNQEWEFERQILKKGQTIAYVYNHDVPEYSETGTIGIELTTAGGLRRVSF